MGIFSSIKAMKAVEAMKHGGKAKISYAQIATLIINLMDAKKKFDSVTFNQIFSLYKEFQTCKTPFEVDLNGYYLMALDIIKKFDQIAPYEKYSGGSEMEFSFLMEKVRRLDNEIYQENNFEEDVPLEEQSDRNELLEKLLMRITLWLEKDLLFNPVEGVNSNNENRQALTVSRGALEVGLCSLVYSANLTVRKLGYDVIYDWYYDSILSRNGGDEENADALMTIFVLQDESISADLKWLIDLDKSSNLSYTLFHVFASVLLCRRIFPHACPFNELYSDKTKVLEYAERIASGEHFSDQFTRNVIVISDFLDELLLEI